MSVSPVAEGRTDFAFERGALTRDFAATVRADGCGELLGIIDAALNLDVPGE